MIAAILNGKNEALQITEVENPEPGKGEVLVHLLASALNHRDVYIRQGLYAGIEYPVILGSDGAGTVEKVGEGVDTSWLGKEVVINPSLDWGEDPRCQGKDYRILGMPDNGTFAGKLVIGVNQLHEKPGHLTWEGAAALPLAGLTAYRALFSRARLQKGEKVLITGIGGGVAQFAAQFALANGAEVWATSGSEEKLDQAKEFGLKGGANYRTEGWVKQLRNDAGSFDVIIDSAGGPGFTGLIDLAASGGRIAQYGGTVGKMDGLSPQKIFWKQLSILGSTMGNEGDFRSMLEFVSANKLVPNIDQVYSLEEVNHAFKRMEKGGQFGKIVIQAE